MNLRPQCQHSTGRISVLAPLSVSIPVTSVEIGALWLSVTEGGNGPAARNHLKEPSWTVGWFAFLGRSTFSDGINTPECARL
jgi:hypothetical protein